MNGYFETAGERVAVESELAWVTELVAEGAAGELTRAAGSPPGVVVRVEATRRPFALRGYRLVTRGVWRDGCDVVLENVCAAGFDARVRVGAGALELTYRWRPPLRDRGAALVLRSRFHLLARAALVQYPALWWSGTRGRVPLHASACELDGGVALVVAAGGVGRSTLLLRESERGRRATGDNLAVGDGTTIWGLLEPARVAGAGGRQMPHGRGETPFPYRAPRLVPDLLVVVERGSRDRARIAEGDVEHAARSLVTSTYMAGELRRYWPFAATLAAATGTGPAHPAVAETAAAFAARLPCRSLELGTRATSLSEVLDVLEVAA